MPIIRLPNDSLRGKTAIIYTRVSSEDQAERLTHEAQEAECRQFAELNGLQVVRAINEQHTGSELWERPKLTAIRDAMRAGSHDWDAIIFHAANRLGRSIARNFVVLEDCSRAGVAALFATEDFDTSPEGQMFFALRSYQAEAQRIRIREDTARGRRARVASGRMINASTPLYGYTQDKETSARMILESEARIVRRIWQLAADGLGMRSIAHRLNAEAIPSPAVGKRAYKDGRAPLWGKSTIQRILREPGYAGLSVGLRWEHRKAKGKTRLIERPREEWIILPDGLTPPIITPEEFDRMQGLIAGRDCGDAKRNEQRFALLRGLIFCGKCGRRRMPDQDGYRCASRVSASGSCGSPATPRLAIEAWAWEQMRDQLDDLAGLVELLRAAPAETPEQDAQRAAELETALAKLAGQQKRLVASQAKAESDELAELYGAEIRKNEAERRMLQAELDRMRRNAASKLAACDDLVTLARQVQAFARIPPQEDRRAVLVAFGVRIEADGRAWEFRIGAG